MEDYIGRLGDKIKMLVGYEVNYVRFSYQVDINFISAEASSWNHPNIQLQAFKMLINGKPHAIDSENINVTVTLALVELLHKKLVKSELHSPEQLVLTFENGISILLNPSLIDHDWAIY